MKSPTTCLPTEQIHALLSGDLPPVETACIEEHLAECSECREAVEAAIGDDDWWDDARRSLAGGRIVGVSAGVDSALDIESATTTEQLLELLGPTDDPAMLGRIGSYDIVGILGRGGMGAVFKGYDPSLNRFVAIKVLQPHLATSGAARKRFAREAQAAAAVVDDHVMAIHGVSEWRSIPYFVMPYSRGVSLQKRLSNQGPLDLREILRIGMQAAKGLAAAHAQGLVHRDVKPANIFLDEGVERVQLMDFGLARAVDDASLTRTGVLAGTPQYMSPEQARAETVDARSDLFSLGAVLYAMCAGHAPFRAESSHAVLRLITDRHPRPIREINPDIPEWLSGIVDKLMSKQPGDRFESAAQVAVLLEACLAHVQEPTRVSLPAELSKLQPACTSRRISWKGVFLMLGAIGTILLGTALLSATHPPDISGRWQGDDWGEVVLEKSDENGKQYAGTFAQHVAQSSGRLTLKWSRIERRFNGTWSIDDGSSGKLSLRLNESGDIQGARTSRQQSPGETGLPRLGDFEWERIPIGIDITNPVVSAAGRPGIGSHVAATLNTVEAPLSLAVTPVFLPNDIVEQIDASRDIPVSAKAAMREFIAATFRRPTPQLNGKGTALAHVTYDRKRTEEALRVLEDLLFRGNTFHIPLAEPDKGMNAYSFQFRRPGPSDNIVDRWDFKIFEDLKVRAERNPKGDYQAATTIRLQPGKAEVLPWFFHPFDSDLRVNYRAKHAGEPFLVFTWESGVPTGTVPAGVLNRDSESRHTTEAVAGSLPKWLQSDYVMVHSQVIPSSHLPLTIRGKRVTSEGPASQTGKYSDTIDANDLKSPVYLQLPDNTREVNWASRDAEGTVGNMQLRCHFRFVQLDLLAQGYVRWICYGEVGQPGAPVQPRSTESAQSVTYRLPQESTPSTPYVFPQELHPWQGKWNVIEASRGGRIRGDEERWGLKSIQVRGEQIEMIGIYPEADELDNSSIGPLQVTPNTKDFRSGTFAVDILLRPHGKYTIDGDQLTLEFDQTEFTEPGESPRAPWVFKLRRTAYDRETTSILDLMQGTWKLVSCMDGNERVITPLVTIQVGGNRFDQVLSGDSSGNELAHRYGTGTFKVRPRDLEVERAKNIAVPWNQLLGDLDVLYPSLGLARKGLVTVGERVMTWTLSEDAPGSLFGSDQLQGPERRGPGDNVRFWVFLRESKGDSSGADAGIWFVDPAQPRSLTEPGARPSGQQLSNAQRELKYGETLFREGKLTALQLDSLRAFLGGGNQDSAGANGDISFVEPAQKESCIQAEQLERRLSTAQRALERGEALFKQGELPALQLEKIRLEFYEARLALARELLVRDPLMANSDAVSRIDLQVAQLRLEYARQALGQGEELHKQGLLSEAELQYYRRELEEATLKLAEVKSRISIVPSAEEQTDHRETVGAYPRDSGAGPSPLLEQLQGHWAVTRSLEHGGDELHNYHNRELTIEIERNLLVLRGKDREQQREFEIPWELMLTGTDVPQKVDILDDPTDDPPCWLPGIIELKDGRLRICCSMECRAPEDKRPRHFAGGTNTWLLEARRQRAEIANGSVCGTLDPRTDSILRKIPHSHRIFGREADKPDAPRSLLSDAVEEFNHKQSRNEVGATQPPLTDDEVIAAVRWAAVSSDVRTVTDEELCELLSAVEDSMLPDSWGLKFREPSETSSWKAIKKWDAYLELDRGDGKRPTIPVRARYLRISEEFAEEPLLGGFGTSKTPISDAVVTLTKERRDLKDLPQVARSIASVDEREVIAALADYLDTNRETLDAAEYQLLNMILETRALPANVRLEILSRYESLGGTEHGYDFNRWSLRLLYPRMQGDQTLVTAVELGFHFIDSAPVERVPDDKISWGPPSPDGLQLGVRLAPAGHALPHALQFRPTFYFRNRTGQSTVALEHVYRHYEIDARTSTGDRLPTRSSMNSVVTLIPLTPSDLSANARFERQGVPFLAGSYPAGEFKELEFNESLYSPFDNNTPAHAVNLQNEDQVRLRFKLPYPGPDAEGTLLSGEVRLADVYHAPDDPPLMRMSDDSQSPEIKKPGERMAVLTPKQIVEHGEKLYHSRERIAAQFKVASIRPSVVVDETGTQREHYNFYAEGVPAFSVHLTDKAVNWLKIRSAADVDKHFVGKWIRVEGTVYGVGLDLINRPTQWTYHIDLNSPDQLREIEPATLDAGIERESEQLKEDPFGDPPVNADTEEQPAPERKPADENPAAPAKPAAEGAQPSGNAQFNDGWEPYKNSETLAAMTGWVIAWDDQHDSKGDGERRAILRVFPDGRVASVQSLNGPLVQARLDAQAIAELIERLQQQGTRRAIDQAMVVRNNVPLQAEDYQQLQAQLKEAAHELNLGDPLPQSLWNQSGSRVTVRKDDELYDLLSITPPVNDAGKLTDSTTALLTDEVRDELLELVAIACLGGNEQLAQCISFVNQQVARNLPEQKCEIDRSHLAWASRDREGAIAAFQYTPGPVGGQYPFGEIKVRLSPLGVVSVMESRF